MISSSPIPTTPPVLPVVPSSRNTPPRHDSDGNRLQDDRNNEEFLSRMREAVMTHYRTSPSAPDRPIDLTHVKDTSTTLIASLSNGAPTVSASTAMNRDSPPLIPMRTEEEDDDEEYVPPGLADFVANVNRELEQQQSAFLYDPSIICSVDQVDTEDTFYTNQNQPLENVTTDENDTDEDSSKMAIRNDILQRCDLYRHGVVLSDDSENFAGSDPSRNDTALMWSPDIFTSPDPINPASLLSVSQIKHHIFTSPLMTPIPMIRPISEHHEVPPMEPLHSLPQFTLSETNRQEMPTPYTAKEPKVYSTITEPSGHALPFSLEKIRLSPSQARPSSNVLALDRSSTTRQKVSFVEEPTKTLQYQEKPTLEMSMSRLDLFASEDEEEFHHHTSISNVATTYTTPSLLSMTSPSNVLTPLQPLGRRASSPIYGYAPTPENQVGTINGISQHPPPPPLSDPLEQIAASVPTTTTKTMSPGSSGIVKLNEMARQKSQPPPMGSLLQRATKKILSNSPRNESDIRACASSSTEIAQDSLPELHPELTIARSSSMDERNAMAPSPKQKFTNRPPQNKPMTTPSPQSMGRSLNGTEKEIKLKPPECGSASQKIANYSRPPKMSASPSLAVSDTPSPLSMSSPMCSGHDSRSAFEPSSLTTKNNKKVSSSLVPRFGTPPSPVRIKPASHFSAEAAERLSRPSKSPLPPTSSTRRAVPHYASPLKKMTTNEKATPSATLRVQIMNKHPFVSPPLQNRDSVTLGVQTKSSAKRLSMSAINRLSQPSSTESRRRSVVKNSATTSVHVQFPLKELASPPLPPSASCRPESFAPSAPSTVSDNSGFASRRRGAERILRSKSSKVVGHLSPTRSSQTSSLSIARNLTNENATEKSLPKKVSRKVMPSYKLSSGFEKSFRPSLVSNIVQVESDVPIPIVVDQQAVPAKTKGENIIDRLSRPTKSRAIAIHCTLNPPAKDDDEELNAQIPIVVHRPPSPFVLTTVERLTQPTVARKAAMKSSGYAPRKPSLPSSSNNGGSVIGRHGATNESPKLPNQLDSSSHLLQGTAVSKAKKALPKKSTVRPPTPTRFVSGASDRLMKPTAAYRASTMPSNTGRNPQPEKVSNGRKLNHDAKRRDSQFVDSSNKATRPLTVPRGPRCANLPPSNKQKFRKECIEAPSLAQILDTFGKGLRDDSSVASGVSNFSRRSLTIPTGPRLATNVRGGDKYKPPKMNSDASLADSNFVLQNGLRSPYHSKHGQRQRIPTIPISPKFAPLLHRERPKSTTELEAEEMEYFKGHQFKARPPLHRSHIPNTTSHQIDAAPRYMKPTQVTKLNPKGDRQSLMSRNQPTVTLNRPSTATAANKRRPIGVPTSIVTTNLGLAQRVQVDDEGLKDLVENAARAANALAIREEARQEKLAQEEDERRELSTFKAKPIPLTTYIHNPIIPAPAQLVEPFSPELQTRQRVKERKEFDEYAEQERRARLEHLQAMEDERQADEDDEINERRRLPVSEGGMIPVAAPVNAVFWNE